MKWLKRDDGFTVDQWGYVPDDASHCFENWEAHILKPPTGPWRVLPGFPTAGYSWMDLPDTVHTTEEAQAYVTTMLAMGRW